MQAPDGALAWLEGSSRMPSRWLYAEDQVATLRTKGAYLLDVREVEGRRVVPGIMGWVDAAEFMAMAGRVDALEARLSALEGL